MEKSKYTAQARHIKENYSQFKFNIKPELLELFKRKCAENGTTPTSEIKKFIGNYCEKSGKEGG